MYTFYARPYFHNLWKWYMALLACTASLPSLAQDAFPSMPYANRSLLNPAFAGLIEAKVGLNFSQHLYRATDLANFNTSTANLDVPIHTKPLTGGAGLLVSSDHIAGITDTRFSGIFAAEAPLGNKLRFNHIRAGFQLGFVQRSVSKPDLIFADQFDNQTGEFTKATLDPVYLAGLASPLKFDASIGLLWYRTQKIKGNPEFNYFLGGTVAHITQPNISFYPSSNAPLKRSYSVIAGGKLRTRKSYDLNINGIYLKQNGSQSLTTSLFIRTVFYEKGVLFGTESVSLYFGTNIRQQLNGIKVVDPTSNSSQTIRKAGIETISPFVGLEYNKTFVVGFSYDVIVSKNTALLTTYGGLQLMAGYYIGGKRYNGQVTPFPIF